MLTPGGWFAYVGVHPGFVHPFAEPVSDGGVVRSGYRQAGWAAPTPFTGTAVRARVGVHHLPLESFFSAFLRLDAEIDRFVERGGDVVPALVGVRLRRRG